MKKVLALILALVMVLSMGTMVFAADTNTNSDGKITIVNATIGKDYAAYKLFDATFKADDKTKVAYTLTVDDDTEDWYDKLSEEGSPFVLEETETDGLYNVSVDSNFNETQVINWLKGAGIPSLLDATAEKAPADANEVVFSSLPYGYYYVTSEVGTAVSINTTLPEVRIIDKNEEPDWDIPDDPDDPQTMLGKVIKDTVLHCGKEAGDKHTHSDACYYTQENSASYGDTVNFVIGVNAKAYDKEDIITSYSIIDTLGAGFTSDKNVEVYIDGVKLTTGYQVNYSTDGKTFQVYIPTVTADAVTPATDPATYNWNPKYGSNFKIEVKYSAKVNDSAVITLPGNLNTANFTYEKDKDYDPDVPTPDTPDTPPYVPEDPDDPYTPPQNPPYDPDNEKETTTYVYAMNLQKVDGKTNEALTGAKFSILGTDGTTPIKATPVAGKNGVYKYDPNGSSAVAEFEVNEIGYLIIEGLKEGTYKVTETLQPDGYNIIKDPFDVELGKDADGFTEKVTTYYDADGKAIKTEAEEGGSSLKIDLVKESVMNYAGTELPETGGIGTTMFYVIGAILVLGAAVILITRKRVTD